MIKISAVTKTYKIGEVLIKAIDNINLTIYTGEFIAIMGKSGSGKSTLLDQIGLIDAPDSGAIFYHGKNILALPGEMKNNFRLNTFGFIFQEHILFPELSVLENVCLPALANGMDLAKARKNAEHILGILNMQDRIRHRPNQLSSGQKQRASLARALINDPEVLLLDEPTANLDSKNSTEILNYLKGINLKLKKTIVMITHEEEDKKYVDRAVYLKDGRISRIKIQDAKRVQMLAAHKITAEIPFRHYMGS